MITNAIGILFSPHSTWQRLASVADRASNLLPILILAMLPAVAWYYGTTHMGWTVGSGEVTKFARSGGIALGAALYVGLVVWVCIIGWSIHWMATSYGAQSTLMRGITVAGFTAVPMLIAGVVGFNPVPSIVMVVGLASAGWSLYLLYIGIPAVMKVPQDRGFLFASAVVAVCLVILIAMMGAGVILWDMFSPEFSN
jgi:hypothetical protein